VSRRRAQPQEEWEREQKKKEREKHKSDKYKYGFYIKVFRNDFFAVTVTKKSSTVLRIETAVTK
jgi:hypothetical protein